MNYFDILFAKKLSGSGGDIDLQDITITENGEVTAPSGVAYKKITTNVPLPANAYLKKSVSGLPVPIASFSDGAEDLPLNSLTASIVPVQAGSGDPSPSNVRPISGWSAVNVYRTSFNIWDEEYKVSGTGIRAKNFIRVFPNTTYYFKSPCNVAYYRYGANKNYFDSLTLAKDTSFTTLSNQYYMWFDAGDYYGNTTYNNDISINYPSTDTEYHAYNGTTITIPFTDGQGQSVEVFGGSVDVIDGVVTPCPYYASYNGEQLTGEWISDRDVYTPNTSPTIGAQVVNIGATGTPFSVQPTSIKSLDGENNVFASTGDVTECEYFGKEST